ncbi:hypothetical protein LINPERHAP2_LOCUS15691 [Linum perenne]
MLGTFLHGGATTTLVDLVGSVVIFTVGPPRTGVSVEINVSYLDAAYVNMRVARMYRSISSSTTLHGAISLVMLSGRDRDRSQDSASWEGCLSRQRRVQEEEKWSPDGDIIDRVPMSSQPTFDHPYLKDYKSQRYLTSGSANLSPVQVSAWPFEWEATLGGNNPAFGGLVQAR